MSSSSSSSSSSLPSAHDINFSNNPNRKTAQYPDFTGYREGYTDPSVLALGDVAKKIKLPMGWEKLPLTSAPSRLYELPRQKFYTPLSETDEKYADAYSNALHAPEGEYIVPVPREKRMSKAERDAWRLKQASERRERIYNAPDFKGKDGKPDLSLIYQAKHAYTQRQAMKAQEERAEKWRKKWGTPGDYQALQKSLALKNIGRRLPASITDASYLDYLNREEIAGYSRDQLPDGFEYLRESNFVGKTPQTLTPAEKNKMMLQFGELVGILGVDPVYDPRLTSVASAQALYPAPDYTVSVYNLDDNILTPGTVIVQTNISTRDYAGNFVPEGQIIAIGGYKLANPSSARSIAELERMMYYGKNDTNEKRQKQTFQDWKVEHGFIKPKQKATGMRQIADFVKSILERKGVEMPVRVKVGDRFTEMPAFMKLRFKNTLNKEMIATYYKVSSVVMNTIISRTAELFFNFVIAPLLYNDLKNETSNLMISSFLKACMESEAIPWDATKFFSLTLSTADMSKYLGVDFNYYIMIFWKKSYFHPKALGAFLHYKTIKDKVDKLIT